MAQAEEDLALAEARTIEAQETVAQKSENCRRSKRQWRDAQQKLNDQRAASCRPSRRCKLEAAHQRNANQMLQQLEQRRNACRARKRAWIARTKCA
jgi:chromosome segregation protein